MQIKLARRNVEDLQIALDRLRSSRVATGDKNAPEELPKALKQEMANSNEATERLDSVQKQCRLAEL